MKKVPLLLLFVISTLKELEDTETITELTDIIPSVISVTTKLILVLA